MNIEYMLSVISTIYLDAKLLEYEVRETDQHWDLFILDRLDEISTKIENAKEIVKKKNQKVNEHPKKYICSYCGINVKKDPFHKSCRYMVINEDYEIVSETYSGMAKTSVCCENCYSDYQSGVNRGEKITYLQNKQ